jgi:hypothetical protein
MTSLLKTGIQMEEMSKLGWLDCLSMPYEPIFIFYPDDGQIQKTIGYQCLQIMLSENASPLLYIYSYGKISLELREVTTL